MKTINALFTSVIVKHDSITAALHFDYDEAEKTMLHILPGNFNPRTDDALIFTNTVPGEGTPVFNYRAYLNDEEKPQRPTGKENRNVKIFFECPKCPSTSGSLKADEEGDIVMVCKECSTPVFVK